MSDRLAAQREPDAPDCPRMSAEPSGRTLTRPGQQGLRHAPTAAHKKPPHVGENVGRHATVAAEVRRLPAARFPTRYAPAPVLSTAER